ncbi:MAG: hypothetical protein IPH13_22940 [Planctomycetes bacterium]|nr:hypothetical protein [Planctomycetota bacterium]MCC7169355.1 hypothetical protein [Planctomycetota bacterium]
MTITRLLAVASAALLVPTLDAKTLFVASNGPLTSIQDPIDLADADDTIVLKAGIYVETLRILGKDGLELRGVGSVIVDGRELGSGGDGPAITIEAALQSVVTDNRVKIGSAAGIRIGAGSGSTPVARNVAQRCSNEGAAGFDLHRDDVTMFDNLAKDNVRHSLCVLRVGCDIECFTSTRNLRDGIRLESTASGTRLTDALVPKNGEHGIANLANGVELRIAVLLANRLDLANDGTFAVLDQVQFQSGGANVDVEPN